MQQQTFGIIKPDAIQRNLAGPIIAMIEDSGLKVSAIKMVKMTLEQAKGFYAVHSERPFFQELIEYITSGPIICFILTGENAVTRYRDLMGATNPSEAREGSIRKKFALSIQENAVHGSDSPETASIEIQYFFNVFERTL